MAFLRKQMAGMAVLVAGVAVVMLLRQRREVLEILLLHRHLKATTEAPGLLLLRLRVQEAAEVHPLLVETARQILVPQVAMVQRHQFPGLL